MLVIKPSFARFNVTGIVVVTVGVVDGPWVEYVVTKVGLTRSYGTASMYRDKGVDLWVSQQ